MFDWNVVMGAIGDYIIVPIIAAIGVAIVVVIKHRADKIAKSVVAKNELDEMGKKNTIRKDIISSLSTVVEAAVGSNMQLADAMKKSGNGLTPEQVAELNRTAKELVLNSLPPSLTNDDGVLLEIIGGRDRLDAIITSMMEKYVYEYKLRPKVQQPEPMEQKPVSSIPFINGRF